MKPPYEINSKILQLITVISEKIGRINASLLIKETPDLRKQNKIKTIHSSLRIEGNTLTEDQITAILENKRIVGPQKDIKEVQNAIEVYDQIDSFKFDSSKSFLLAHKILMNGLIENPGKFRNKSVGIVKGDHVEHFAPPAENVPFLMNDLFGYVKNDSDPVLIKSCVFHYEMEFIHPFLDGNGRMGRLWQSIILNKEYQIFQYIPFETLISRTQEEYYKVLSQSDKIGQSTPFIEYMLKVIDKALSEIIDTTGQPVTQRDRLIHFASLDHVTFTRKDYMKVFNNLSSASASRDLKKGIEEGLFKKHGDKRTTEYTIIKK